MEYIGIFERIGVNCCYTDIDLYINHKTNKIMYKCFIWDNRRQVDKFNVVLTEKPVFPVIVLGDLKGCTLKLTLFASPEKTFIYNSYDVNLWDEIEQIVMTHVVRGKEPFHQEEKKGNTTDIMAKQLTVDNIVEYAVAFYKGNDQIEQNIISVIQAMLNSKRYILDASILSNKLDFAQANTFFKSHVAPQQMKKNELKHLIFHNAACDDLLI
jgi:hypothetical protein